MKKFAVLAIALAAAPFAASAGGVSYNYIEGGYAQLNQELPDVDLGGGMVAHIDDIEAGGFYVSGSVALGESFHLFGGYRAGNDDVTVTVPGFGSGSSDIDLNQFNAGVGYHYGLSDRADLVTELSYVRTDVDAEGESMSADDARIAVGVRGLLADSFEGWVKGNYTDGDAYDGEFSATVGGQFKFNPTWGITGEAEFGDSTSQYTIGVRASF
jgi:Ax21 family sulfation-dependent quorum factor